MIHWANATHACTCEVDIETGHVTLTRYIVSEDVGPMINPNVVEGQIAGGTVQGIGGALLENMAYDDDGNPLSSTFVDYLLPTATEVPPIEFGHVEIPGPGVGGYKGAGEGGAIGSTPAVINADQRRAGPARCDRHPAAGQPRARSSNSSKQRADVRKPESGAEQRIPGRRCRGKTWEVLTDVERVAPCIPGAQLLSVDGDDFTGAVKVKVGPITVSYKGDAPFLEKDAAAQRVVIKASGKETRGSGNAAAIVTAQLKDEGPTPPACVITTDLTISGKAAQFGRGVLADVSGKPDRPVRQRPGGRSARRGSAPDGRRGTACAAAASRRSRRRRGCDSVDLLKVVAVPMAKRVRARGRRRSAGRCAASVSCSAAAGGKPRYDPGRAAAGRAGAAAVMKAARVRLPPPRHRRRGRARLLGRVRRRRARSSPAGRAWCRCSPCG